MARKFGDVGQGRENLLVLTWRDPWHPEGGGSERWIQEVAGRLTSRARVTVFTARYADSAATESIGGVRYVRRGGHLTVFLWAALFLLTRRFGRLDAVLEIQNGMPFLARLFTRARVVVLVHHVHREQWPVVGRGLARIGWFMESRVAVRVNRGLDYLSVSAVTRSELIDLGVDPGAISLAWNGCQPVPALGEPVVATASPTLVVLGRLVPHKQVEHAIRATAALLPDFPGLRLRIIGSGWWEDELRGEIERLGVQGAVDLLGHVDETSKYRELAAGWVHLLPSLKEGWGLSIIEAAQVGVPSIAYSAAGGVRDSVLDGVTGLLARDEAHFVELTRTLLADATLRHELGAKARARTAEFTWESTVASVTSALFVG